jgi:adenosine deaminase
VRGVEEAWTLRKVAKEDMVPLPPTDLYETVLRRLKEQHPRFLEHEITSLLVSILSIAEGLHGRDAPQYEEEWDYLRDLTAPLQESPLRALFEQRLQCAADLQRSFVRHGTGPARKGPGTASDPWTGMFDAVCKRVNEVGAFLEGRWEGARDKLTTRLPRQKTGGKDVDWSSIRIPPLKTFVIVPPDPHPDEQNLARYLWGAGLLGADHLQYPENLLLAAHSLVRQAVDDRILYTELRCETIGYTRAGLGAIEATDLLCYALDLAVLHEVRSKPEAWSRFNILLGAKRHKADHFVGQIAELVSFYLQRGEPGAPPLGGAVPGWWKPAAVVGFDLSGQEQEKSEDHLPYIQPLFKYSAPITIHAGEQKPAEIIWEAVYRYGARRIGHGLRLRENLRLLDYCIREGICMEMCPVSNRFTNGFPQAGTPRCYESPWPEYYPLRYYLERGLDVCINTDNRQLHGQRSTLTDEYMAAAELAGGLTAWEVLRIVKCGFKHAFLPKEEVARLLSAVEDRILNDVVPKFV